MNRAHTPCVCVCVCVLGTDAAAVSRMDLNLESSLEALGLHPRNTQAHAGSHCRASHGMGAKMDWLWTVCE